jgi:diaminohydroxyphosphoribosylaminopyrimidine deaminase / 5-amino-6-(5-phosphoribosylamino)uracil reductase
MKANPPDQNYMNYAFRLGRRALGTTAENPAVGCVIVDQGRVVGVGCTRAGGRPHAEVVALAMAGSSANGATAYVTLEPCAHHGKTGPCAEALITAGIARVVIAVEDPDPRVAGKGTELLRSAGIAVESAFDAAAGREAHAGFFSRMIRKRPQVILKLAVSSDFKIAAGLGVQTQITGEHVKNRVHLMRAQSDAILVGMGTVLADNPELTCRLPGLEQRSPKPYVYGHGPLPAQSHMALQLAQLVDDPLPQILSAMADDGINTLMVEGGAKTARRFLEANLIDEFHIFTAPIKLGPNAVDALAGLSLTDALHNFHHIHNETLGRDQLDVYRKL